MYQTVTYCQDLDPVPKVLRLYRVVGSWLTASALCERLQLPGAPTASACAKPAHIRVYARTFHVFLLLGPLDPVPFDDGSAPFRTWVCTGGHHPPSDPAADDLALLRVRMAEARPGDPDVLRAQAVFEAACDRGDADLALALLEAAPWLDAGAHRGRALTGAAGVGHTALVRTLLRRPDVDPAAEGYRVLVAAAAQGHPHVLQDLLSDPRVASHDVERAAPALSRALYEAAAAGHASVVKMLLDLPPGAKVSPSSEQGGCDALTAAAAGGHGAVVELLLAARDVFGARRVCTEDGAAARAALHQGHNVVAALVLQADALADL